MKLGINFTYYQRMNSLSNLHETRYKTLPTQHKFRENKQSYRQKLLKEVNKFPPHVPHFFTDLDEIWNRESSHNAVE